LKSKRVIYTQDLFRNARTKKVMNLKLLAPGENKCGGEENERYRWKRTEARGDHRKSINLQTNINASGKYIIAVIDQDNMLAELDETNNIITSDPIP
jgi:hypothetical protein